MNSKVWVENVPEEYDDMGDVRVGNKSILSYHVFLDSSNNFINITYSLHKRIPLSIELVNLLGQKVKTIQPKRNQQAGSHILQIPVSDFPIGTYFLTISSTIQKETKKIIINE